MKNRISAIAITLLATSTNAAFAQQRTAGNVVIAQQCDEGVAASLGFSYKLQAANGATIYASPGSYIRRSGEATIGDEPLVGDVDNNGPASGKLQEGDRIARVNGYPVTSAEGSAALRTARPGVSLVLTVRRDDKLVPVTVVPAAMKCPTRVPAAVAQGSGYASTTAGIHVTGRYAPGVAMVAPTGEMHATTAAGAVMATEMNPGWLGIGFDCSGCGQRYTPNGREWYFTEPPTIYNVDTGSPAYTAGIRRGDVLLRVDGKDVTTPFAGARLGQVKPGQTLKLTYSRAGAKRDASLRVAQSPAAIRSTLAVSPAATALLRSTAELRATTSEAQLRELIRQVEQSKSAEETAMRQLESALRSGNNNDARTALGRLRTTKDTQNKTEQRVLGELLRNQQEASRKLTVVEDQMKRASTEQRNGMPLQAFTVTLDSVSGYMRPSLREQRLRYSGSIGASDVEVRGPGSVNVQRDGDDLVIITTDAVIRVKNRTVKDHE